MPPPSVLLHIFDEPEGIYILSGVLINQDIRRKGWQLEIEIFLPYYYHYIQDVTY